MTIQPSQGRADRFTTGRVRDLERNIEVEPGRQSACKNQSLSRSVNGLVVAVSLTVTGPGMSPETPATFSFGHLKRAVAPWWHLVF